MTAGLVACGRWAEEMTLTTEFFALCIFIVGLPFFYSMLRDSGLLAWRYFFASYLFLALSNIFTVIEGVGFHDFFNICQHALIALSAATLLFAVVRLALKGKTRGGS